MRVLPLVNRHLMNLREMHSPITVKQARLPIVPNRKWEETADGLAKSFPFVDNNKRYEFIVGLLGREVDVNHHASMKIDAKNVEVILLTHGVNAITELDREFARYCDTLYKEVVIEHP